MPQDRKKKIDGYNNIFISEDEFVNINFDLEWPRIILDLSIYLTKYQQLTGSRIHEKDELMRPLYHPELCKESDLLAFKNKLGAEKWQIAVNTFKALKGSEPKAKCMEDFIGTEDKAPDAETSLFIEE